MSCPKALTLGIGWDISLNEYIHLSFWQLSNSALLPAFRKFEACHNCTLVFVTYCTHILFICSILKHLCILYLGVVIIVSPMCLLVLIWLLSRMRQTVDTKLYSFVLNRTADMDSDVLHLAVDLTEETCLYIFPLCKPTSTLFFLHFKDFLSKSAWQYWCFVYLHNHTPAAAANLR